MSRWLCCLLVAASAVWCAARQAPAPQADPPGAGAPIQLIPRTRGEREERYKMLHRILLNVQVTDSSGQPVNGLKQDDFVVLDNHREQKVATFRAIDDGAAAKTHVLLVIDTLNNTGRGLSYERKEIEKFLRAGEASLRYPISLVTLVHGDAVVGRPSRSADTLSGELARLTASAHPVDCLDDGNHAGMNANGAYSLDNSSQRRTDLAEGMGNCLNRKFRESISSLLRLAALEVDDPGRSIVIWVGPGWPMLSGPHFLPDTPQQRENFFENLVELSTKLREAQITLDAVSWPELSQQHKLNKVDFDALTLGTPTAAQAGATSLALPVLAYQTGGRVYSHEKGLAEDLGRCLDDADAFYALSFDSDPAPAGDEFRSLEVKTDRPELTVRTNTAYYAQP